MKSIHERVRAQLEKKEREEKKLAAKGNATENRRMGQLAARDARIERLLDGTATPRNQREADIWLRGEFDL